jgi:hypothetical protein
VRRSKAKRRLDQTLQFIYWVFAALLIASSAIDFVKGHWKLGIVEFLIFAVLLTGAMMLRGRERRERLMPVEEPPPRWY